MAANVVPIVAMATVSTARSKKIGTSLKSGGHDRISELNIVGNPLKNWMKSILLIWPKDSVKGKDP